MVPLGQWLSPATTLAARKAVVVVVVVLLPYIVEQKAPSSLILSYLIFVIFVGYTHSIFIQRDLIGWSFYYPPEYAAYPLTNERVI